MIKLLKFRRPTWPKPSPSSIHSPKKNLSSNAALLPPQPHNLPTSSNSQFDSYAYANALKSCINTHNPMQGRAVHCHSLKHGGCLDLFCSNILLDMYVKSNLIADAYKLFDEMPMRNMVSFVTLIRGLGVSGEVSEASRLLLRLHREGHELNHFVFTTGLKLFVLMGRPELGEFVHACVFKLGHDLNPFVGSCLIDSYSLCGFVDEARMVFDGVLEKDIVVWTGMMSCYADNDCAEQAMRLFALMVEDGMSPNHFTLTSLLKASVSLESLDLGKCIHGCSIKMQYESDRYVSGSLLDMYAKCGDIEDARFFFEMVPQWNVILWSSMIARYAQSYQNEEALGIFCRMTRSSVVPNEYSFSSALKACADMDGLELGKQIHGHVVTIGLESESFIANALMDVYVKCGDINSSQIIFSRFFRKNDVAWNTMIVGYVNLCFPEDALRLFCQMRGDEVELSQVTYSSALRACASMVAIEPTSQIHSLIYKTPFIHNNVVGNSLIDSYAKCGSIKSARKVFDMMDYHDGISWNALIAGYSLHGLGSEALSSFNKMREAKVNADAVTFVGVLSACSNMGLVEEGQSYFKSMRHDFGIEPCMEHYTCMVRLLGRSGRLDEALEFIEKIPVEPSAMVWRALLNACLIHKNVDLGKICAEKVLRIEPEDESTHVLLSNIYARAGIWVNVALIRKAMRKKGVKKEPGLSWVEFQGEVHSFNVGQTLHQDKRVINSMLEWLNRKIKKAGYFPDSSVVLHDIDEEQKENLVWMHSERLALAFGLVRIPLGMPIRIIKNLRFCSDCHSVFKLISKVVQREIIVRDMNRYHHFEDGVCSCSDYW